MPSRVRPATHHDRVAAAIEAVISGDGLAKLRRNQWEFLNMMISRPL
jgi:hypothetical protein